MKFIDEVSLTVQSGNGGPGAVSWRREKYVPRGGPDGGDGGAGGSVVMVVNPQLNSLLHFRYRRTYAAGNGQAGGASNMSGAAGADMIMEVPVGTIIRSADGEVLHDLAQEGDRVVFLQGGRGGKGNHFFKTSVNQAPEHAQPGEEGFQQDIKLELKLMADVGIVGFPNAGKSTLISKMSAARPKIADYPFTTLHPNLGVVKVSEFRSFVMADIPGLVPGAHQGVGLGIKFLKHIERTSVFVHLIDPSEFSGREPMDDYRDIQHELEAYDRITLEQGEPSNLMSRKQVVVLGKMDTVPVDRQREIVAQFRAIGIEPMLISAVAGLGLKELTFRLAEMITAPTPIDAEVKA